MAPLPGAAPVSSRPSRRLTGMGPDLRPAAVAVLRRDDGEVILGPVYGPECSDLALVDDLLRVQLAARRFGWCIRLHQVRDDLRELLELTGVTEDLVG